MEVVQEVVQEIVVPLSISPAVQRLLPPILAVQASSASSFDDEAIRTKVDGSEISMLLVTLTESWQDKLRLGRTQLEIFCGQAQCRWGFELVNQFGSSNDERYVRYDH